MAVLWIVQTAVQTANTFLFQIFFFRRVFSVLCLSKQLNFLRDIFFHTYLHLFSLIYCFLQVFLQNLKNNFEQSFKIWCQDNCRTYRRRNYFSCLALSSTVNYLIHLCNLLDWVYEGPKTDLLNPPHFKYLQFPGQTQIQKLISITQLTYKPGRKDNFSSILAKNIFSAGTGLQVQTCFEWQ